MTAEAIHEAADRRRAEIVSAALKLLAETGFEGLSLRRLARYLGMHAPGLYWYLDSKQTLIYLMAKSILEDGLSGVGELTDGETWESWLVELACTIRRTLLATRDGARVVAGAFLFKTDAVTPVLEHGLKILEANGFEPGIALGGIWTLMRFATGSALDEQASPWVATVGPRAAGIARTRPDGPPPIDATRWPRTARAMHSVFDGQPRDRELLFRWGAMMIVNGIARDR